MEVHTGRAIPDRARSINVTPDKPHRFCIAPMMDWTDRHCRFFHRLLTRRALIYTEMITTGAVLHGDRTRLLGFDPAEHPVAVQLGGSDPKALAESARICADLGYDEINLNVGCPSDRVQDGRFGACLMAEPALVGDGVAAMKAAVRIRVTVKCRIGIDDQDPEAALDAFTRTVVAAGADALVVHARKAWLDGLSPKENRDIPPLDYDRVYRLKRANPSLEIAINGGIASVADAATHLGHVDGAMMGRAAYQDPWRLLAVDPELFGAPAPVATPHEAALDAFTRTVVAAGADALVVHARKAWLDGLSPKENRDIPPLDYDRVYRLKRANPDLEIAINGGIASVADAVAHLGQVDGVMMGRAAYQDPWRLLAVDPELFGAPAAVATPHAAALALIPYIEHELARGVRLHAITRHLVGLFHAVPGARAFRRFLATEGVKPGADAGTFRAALALVRHDGDGAVMHTAAA